MSGRTNEDHQAVEAGPVFTYPAISDAELIKLLAVGSSSWKWWHLLLYCKEDAGENLCKPQDNTDTRHCFSQLSEDGLWEVNGLYCAMFQCRG